MILEENRDEAGADGVSPDFLQLCAIIWIAKIAPVFNHVCRNPPGPIGIDDCAEDDGRVGQTSTGTDLVPHAPLA